MSPSGVTRARVLAVVIFGGIACTLLDSTAARAEELKAVAVPTTDFERAATSNGRAAARAVIHQIHHYDPSVRERALEEPTSEPNVVKMEPFEIFESKNQILFERYVAEKRRREAANRPGLANGATLPGFPGVGVIPYKDVTPPFGPPLARWNFLSLRW